MNITQVRKEHNPGKELSMEPTTHKHWTSTITAWNEPKYGKRNEQSMKWTQNEHELCMNWPQPNQGIRPKPNPARTQIKCESKINFIHLNTNLFTKVENHETLPNNNKSTLLYQLFEFGTFAREFFFVAKWNGLFNTQNYSHQKIQLFSLRPIDGKRNMFTEWVS